MYLQNNRRFAQKGDPKFQAHELQEFGVFV